MYEYMAEEEIRTCSQCEQTYDGTAEGDYSEIIDADICEACSSSDWQSSSRAYHVDGDGEVTRYDVGDFQVWNEWGDHGCHEDIRRMWRGGGWRGYYESRPVGDWVETSSGWTTDDWGDSISGGKQAFNAWAEGVIEGRIESPCEMWLCFDPTSNVLSTAVGVWIPAGADLEAVAAAIPRY